MNHLWTALIILTAAIATVAQDTGECNNKACYPSFEDLIVTAFINRTVSVSSTCGDPANDYELIYINTQGEEMLIQETCNASIPEESHPKDYLYDSLKEVQLGVEVDVPNLDTWWQSTNNADNTQLILSLGDEFLFQSMTIAFRSPRPQDMCIETSIDYGITYKKLQYYAQDCASSFPDIPLTDINNPVRVLEATCIEAYYQGDSSTTVPGTIQQVLYNPASLFGSSFFAYESQTYFLATDIRVTLITAPGSGDPLRSFFAVVDWDVTGQCACFGHAEECMGENGADCICQHNTEGKNCESCLPLYNNREWQAGFGSSANECEECGCNGHATSCHYDETKGTGVCDDCTDNTTGDKCELCLPSYFINPYTIPGVNETCDESLVSYPCDQSCLSCNCSVEGTKMNTDCDGISGQCECKTNVEGRACDVCKDTYWNLQPSNPNGCQECTCHAPGSKDTSKFCDKETGQCICKANTEGALCDKCKDGAFSLQASNPDGCTLCNCDIGGAVASLCDKDSGVCGCRGSHIIGRSCNETEAGYYVPKLDGLLYEAELASSDQPIVIEEQPGHGEGDVTGIGYLVVSEGGTVTFSNVVVPRNQQYEVVLRYQSESLWNSFSLTLTMNSPEPYSCGDIDVPGDPIALVAGTDLPAASPSGSKQFGAPCLKGGSSYLVDITADGSTMGTAGIVYMDSLVLLPVLDDISLYTSNDTTQEEKDKMSTCWESSLKADPQQRASLSCSDIEFSMMAEVYGDAIPCNCNAEGSVSDTVCDSHGGQCECLSNIISRTCDYCAVYHYGYESGLGCTSCDCHPEGSLSLSCNHTTGICDCQVFVNGSKCDICYTEYYGLDSGSGCTPCVCESEYSLNNRCSNDGQCDCKSGIGGVSCDVCQAGFYNLTTDGCTACECNVYGTTASECNSNDGTCTCTIATQGDNCDSCQKEYYGLGPWSSLGCIPCMCSGHSTNCTTATDFYYLNLYTDWSLFEEVAVAPRWSGSTAIEGGEDVEVEDIAVVEGDMSRFVLKMTEPPNATELFFVSSEPYNGDKRTAYGQVLSFTISQSQLENQTISDVGDVFIYGMYATEPLVASLPENPNTTATTYTYTLNELDESWRMGDGKTPVFQDFYTILAGIENIYIRAKYTSLEGTSSNLYAVRLDYSVANASLSDTPIDNAELCTCPPEYTGTFCEQCAVGYTRDDPSMGPFATCIPCTCNEHSERGCDPDTGVCVECIHNTAGDQCEVCKPGYYGDAEGGTPDDCHPCMCPGPAGENSFSDVCVADSLAEMGFNCQDTCAVGHQGERCETCETGYYGTPEDYTNEGGVCQECFCNLSPQECDSVTGQCSTCWNNTEGLHCEVCKFGFWGTIDNCQACDCDLVGGYGNCSQDTGLCICKPNVEGDRCTECADRSWGFESGDGCTECDCHSIGTLPGHWQCDPATGQCDCKEKAVGLQCDQCMDGYYDIDIECTMCNCNVNGSSEISCDLETGQCYCNKPTIAGRTCDQCGRVGEDSNLFVDEVFTGPWPDCDPCPECFYNWAESIQEVGDQLNEQYAITLDLLENYDNMPVSLVDQIIVDIQGNLSYAEQVLADAADEVRKLSELNKGFEQIQFEVGNFTEILDNIQVKALNVTLGLAQISTFYGNVEVAPGVFKTPTQIQNDLAIPLATQEAYFSSANTSWFHIQELYNSVQGAGTRVQTLTNEVDNLLSIIQVAESEREAADILINNNILLNENIQNTVLLTEIDNIQSEYPVTEVQEKVDQAYSNAVSANISANSAIVYAETRLDEATAKAYSSQIAKYNTTMAETSTLKAQSAALTYKDAATWAYSNMSQYYVDMLDAYSRLQTSQAQTASMQEVSTQILGMTVPGVDGMETLTEQILQTDISEQIVADTLASAEATLNNANSALNVSLEAETEAQGALALVQGIENTLKEAENVRAAAVESLAQTDSNITNVHDVSNEVIAKGALEETKGQAALTMIAQIRLDILHAGQCFDEELSRANTAEAGANQAKANSEEAVESYTVNAAAQSSISGQVDTVLVEKVIEYNEVKTVSDSAKSLMNDITATAMMEDLQALLQQYITQRTEMDMLMAQMQQMEDDLDGLLTNIEGSEGASIQCDE